jgi:hypothetical protein
MQGASNNADAIRKYVDFTVAFCIKHSNLWQPNPTACKSVVDAEKRENEKVSVAAYQDRTGYTQTKKSYFQSSRPCITRALFGMLGSDSAAFYSQKIAHLEEEQLDWLKLIREQVIVVRSNRNP